MHSFSQDGQNVVQRYFYKHFTIFMISQVTILLALIKLIVDFVTASSKLSLKAQLTRSSERMISETQNDAGFHITIDK